MAVSYMHRPSAFRILHAAGELQGCSSLLALTAVHTIPSLLCLSQHSFILARMAYDCPHPCFISAYYQSSVVAHHDPASSKKVNRYLASNQ